MPRIKTREGATKADAVTSVKFDLVATGKYLARVASCVDETYKVEGQSRLKLVPNIVLYNENETEINFHSVTVGDVDKDGVVFQSDPDKQAKGISGVWASAKIFIAALGWEYVDDFASELVADQLVVVSLYHRKYFDKKKQEDRVVNDIGFVRTTGQIGHGFHGIQDIEKVYEIMGFDYNDNPDPDVERPAILGTMHQCDTGMWFATEAAAEKYDVLEAQLDDGTEASDEDMI